eukprot:4362471-Pleurochrysis_carterae.AAC.1
MARQDAANNQACPRSSVLTKNERALRRSAQLLAYHRFVSDEVLVAALLLLSLIALLAFVSTVLALQSVRRSQNEGCTHSRKSCAAHGADPGLPLQVGSFLSCLEHAMFCRKMCERAVSP